MPMVHLIFGEKFSNIQFNEVLQIDPSSFLNSVL